MDGQRRATARAVDRRGAIRDIIGCPYSVNGICERVGSSFLGTANLKRQIRPARRVLPGFRYRRAISLHLKKASTLSNANTKVVEPRVHRGETRRSIFLSPRKGASARPAFVHLLMPPSSP